MKFLSRSFRSQGSGSSAAVVRRSPWKLCEKVLKAFPETDSQVIYGSTEAEPMAHASMKDAVTIKGNGLYGREAG